MGEPLPGRRKQPLESAPICAHVCPMTRAFDPADIDLTGQILIAMPGMGDPRFDKSVIFMCAHSPEGAMGLIVNKPTGDLRLRDLVAQLEIGDGACASDRGVYFGGPVEPGRGFVLHSGDYYLGNINAFRRR